MNQLRSRKEDLVPKLSVSVPDDLWDRVRSEHPDLSPSRMVQQALSRLLQAPRPAYAPTRDELSRNPDLERLRTKLQAGQVEQFQKGFDRALGFVDERGVTYEELERIASRSCPPLALTEFRFGELFLGARGPVDYLESFGNPDETATDDARENLAASCYEWDPKTEDYPPPTRAFGAGFSEGLRLLLEALVVGTSQQGVDDLTQRGHDENPGDDIDVDRT